MAERASLSVVLGDILVVVETYRMGLGWYGNFALG